jgi:hypothetical protein
MMSVNPVSYIARSPRLLAQLRQVLRYKHYSLRTEESYVYWMRFLRFGSVGTAQYRCFFKVFQTSRPYRTCAKCY